MTGIHFVRNTCKTRAPGMSYMRMPVLCWTSLRPNLLMSPAFPVLTATLRCLLLCYLAFISHDRRPVTRDLRPLVLVWAPEVYISGPCRHSHLSECLDLLRQPLFRLSRPWSPRRLVLRASFVVWLHHFFPWGAASNVNGFFGS